MKTNIRIKFLTLVIAFLGLSGCMSDEDLEESLRGEWVEVYPQSDRTTLIFTSGNKMTLIDGDDYTEVYNYRIDGDEIYLRLAGSEDETALSFDKLDLGRFNIGNLYPSIPESDPENYMTFELIPN